MKRQLVQNILEKDRNSSSSEFLQSLGSAVSALPLSWLSLLTSGDLNNTLTSLSQASWSPAQAKTLAKKLLEAAKVRVSVQFIELSIALYLYCFHNNGVFCRT